MITERDDIVDKFNNRFKDVDDAYKARAISMGLPLYKIPAVSSSSDNYKVITQFSNGLTSWTINSNTSGNYVQQQLVSSLVPPYSVKLSFEVGVSSQSCWLCCNTTYSGNVGNQYYNGPWQDTVVGYFDFGVLWANGSPGNPANPFFYKSPILNTDAVISGTARLKTFGFRELAYGNLELYDERTDSWYPVNASHMLNMPRRLYVGLGYNKIYTVNIKI